MLPPPAADRAKSLHVACAVHWLKASRRVGQAAADSLKERKWKQAG
jgi:hypothetical protein